MIYYFVNCYIVFVSFSSAYGISAMEQLHKIHCKIQSPPYLSFVLHLCTCTCTRTCTSTTYMYVFTCISTMYIIFLSLPLQFLYYMYVHVHVHIHVHLYVHVHVTCILFPKPLHFIVHVSMFTHFVIIGLMESLVQRISLKTACP